MNKLLTVCFQLQSNEQVCFNKMVALDEISISSKINPYLIFFRVFGLQYFSLKETANPKKIHSKYIVYFTILAILIVVSFVGQIIQTPHVDHAKDSSKTMVEKSIRVIEYCGLFLTAFTLLLQSFTTTTQNKRIFINFDKIASLSWNKIFYKIEYEKFQKQYRFKFVVMFTMLIGPLLIALVIHELAHKETTSIFVLEPIFLINFSYIRYVFYEELIHFHLTAVEKILKKHCSKTIIVSYVLDNYNVTKACKPTKWKNEHLIERVYVAKQIYGLIWENTQLINECFGWTIMMKFVLIIIGLIVNGYKIFIFMHNQEIFNLFIG